MSCIGGDFYIATLSAPQDTLNSIRLGKNSQVFIDGEEWKIELFELANFIAGSSERDSSGSCETENRRESLGFTSKRQRRHQWVRNTDESLRPHIKTKTKWPGRLLPPKFRIQLKVTMRFDSLLQSILGFKIAVSMGFERILTNREEWVRALVVPFFLA